MSTKQNKWMDKTRGGYPVRIYNGDANIFHHVHGAMNTCGNREQWNCVSWTEKGGYSNICDSPYDLMPIRKRIYKTLNEIAADYSFDYSPHRIAIVGNDGVVYSMPSSNVGSGEVAPVSRAEEWLEIFTKGEVDE